MLHGILEDRHSLGVTPHSHVRTREQYPSHAIIRILLHFLLELLDQCFKCFSGRMRII